MDAFESEDYSMHDAFEPATPNSTSMAMMDSDNSDNMISDGEAHTDSDNDPCDKTVHGDDDDDLRRDTDTEDLERQNTAVCYGFYRADGKDIGAPRELLIFSPSRVHGAPPQKTARIYQFADMMHLMHCFRDAVYHHKVLWMNGVLHHNVTPYSIELAGCNAPSGRVGRLADSLDPIFLNPETLRNSRDKLDLSTKRLSFKSVMQLLAIESPYVPVPAEDHLDDLEAFFYSLAWIAGHMDGPQNLHHATNALEWETKTASESSEEKEDICYDAKLGHLNRYFWRPAFWKMFTALGKLCSKRIEAKFHAIVKVSEDYRRSYPSLQETHEADGGAAHDEFLAIVDTAIGELYLDPKDMRHLRPKEWTDFEFAHIYAQSEKQKGGRKRKQDFSDEEYVVGSKGVFRRRISKMVYSPRFMK